MSQKQEVKMTLSYQTWSPDDKIWCRQVDVPVDPHKIPIQVLKYFLLLVSPICFFESKFFLQYYNINL